MNDTIALLKRRRSAPPAGHDRAGPDARRNSRRCSPWPRACPTTASSRRGASSYSQGAARERAGRIALMIRLEDKPELDEKGTGGRTRAVRARAAGGRGRLARGAPLKIPEWEQVLSAGAVCMNLIVAARALGFAATWLTEWTAYDARFCAAIGLAEHERIAGFIHIGRAGPDRGPAAPAARRDRHHLSRVRRKCSTRPGQRDKTALPHDPFKAIVAPRPIGWISTRALDGRVNLAPYSFFNGFASAADRRLLQRGGYKDSADVRRAKAASSSPIWRRFDLMQRR